MGICVVRLTINFKNKYDTHLAYNIYTLLCAVNFKTMKIEIHLLSQSKAIVYENVKNAYTKD